MPFEIHFGESALDPGDITMLWPGDKSRARLSTLPAQAGTLEFTIFTTKASVSASCLGDVEFFVSELFWEK